MSGSLEDVVEAYSKSISVNTGGSFASWRTRHLEVFEISLCDAQGDRLQYIDTDTPIFLHIRYRLLERGRPGFVLSVLRDGQVIFKTINIYITFTASFI